MEDLIEQIRMLQKQRDQALHLLSGGVLNSGDVADSGLGVGVLIEHRRRQQQLAELKEQVAVLQSQVDNHDVTLEQQKLSTTRLVWNQAVDKAIEVHGAYPPSEHHECTQALKALKKGI